MLIFKIIFSGTLPEARAVEVETEDVGEAEAAADANMAALLQEERDAGCVFFFRV